MLRSMTGYGGAIGQVDGIEYAVELRSVNHRYFKATVKLPESWTGAEIEIEQILRQRVYRGSVTLTVRMRIPDEKAAYRVNTVALRNYVDQLQSLEIEGNPTLRIDLGTLLQLPGVCEPPPMEDIVETTHDGLIKLIEAALDEMMKMRETEGNALRADLLNNCRVIDESLAIVAKRAPDVVREYHQRLTQRVNELTAAAQITIDQEQLAREVAIYAERCDVAEEISRLGGHVQQFREAFSIPEPAGRKLDFIAQEMLREANTIASKSSDVEIARAVVEIKTAVDRIKEQAANAE